MKQWATVNKHCQRGAIDNTWQDVLMLFIRKQPILFYSMEFNALHWNQWATVTKAWQDRASAGNSGQGKIP